MLRPLFKSVIKHGNPVVLFRLTELRYGMYTILSKFVRTIQPGNSFWQYNYNHGNIAILFQKHDNIIIVVTAEANKY